MRRIVAIVAVAGSLGVAAQAQTAKPYVAPPLAVGQQLFFANKMQELDALVAKLIAEGTRNDDGDSELALLTYYLGQAMVSGEPGEEASYELIRGWRKNFPNSAYAPIAEASLLHRSAWAARGSGYSSSVTDEGWQIFRERNQQAWDVLMKARKQASSIPEWYALAIDVGVALDVQAEQLKEVFDTGKKRFPQYHEVYLGYVKQFAPRWGGDYRVAREFIEEQVAGKTVPDPDVLYTRMFWALDSWQGSPTDFFEESGANWQRMRKGFEKIVRQFPDGEKSATVMAAFACRAHDADTYRTLRPSMSNQRFREYIKPAYTLAICDRRFAPQTQ